MEKAPKNEFIPIISFNHPIFTEISAKSKKLIENRPQTISRQVQVRSLLYITFNTYLSRLIANLPEEAALDLIDELESIDDEKELLKKICVKLNETNEELINNYLQLFAK